METATETRADHREAKPKRRSLLTLFALAVPAGVDCLSGAAVMALWRHSMDGSHGAVVSFGDRKLGGTESDEAPAWIMGYGPWHVAFSLS
jgi:hypothetical protein